MKIKIVEKNKPFTWPLYETGENTPFWGTVTPDLNGALISLDGEHEKFANAAFLSEEVLTGILNKIQNQKEAKENSNG